MATKKAPPTPRQWELINIGGTTTQMMTDFFLPRLDRVAETRGIHAPSDIEILFRGVKDGCRLPTWHVELSLGGHTKAVTNSRADWLTGSKGRLEILEAFDELCTQHLAEEAAR